MPDEPCAECEFLTECEEPYVRCGGNDPWGCFVKKKSLHAIKNSIEIGRKLAEAVKKNCASICTCSAEYRDRKKQDPSCEYCEIGRHLIPLADSVMDCYQ